jgi:hypothetical protein
MLAAVTSARQSTQDALVLHTDCTGGCDLKIAARNAGYHLVIKE